MATAGVPMNAPDPATYQRRVRAWTLYDWANSAFATTILAAVLPVYFSQVAGATLPNEATATAYWSLNLSISLFVTAILAPILGTISDVSRGKKKFLAFFTGAGVIATGLLVLVGTGDWVLASILFVLGRIGFVAAYTFYDALLPHVAKPEDRDNVSARGYAMGYLGGGLLLAINVVMIFVLPDTWGPRLSFLSVAVWWAVFSIPIFRQVPEPASAIGHLQPGQTVIGESFKRLIATFRDMRHYRELFKYLIAFLIYNDAIGTIIGVATIYGAELGFGSVELILALLLVQFAGIPFSLIFGRLPSRETPRRPLYLAFIVFNLFALPLVGIGLRAALPGDISGDEPPPYEATATAVGQGTYLVTDQSDAAPLAFSGEWAQETISADLTGTENQKVYALSGAPEDAVQIVFNGQAVELTYAARPDGGMARLELDGQPYIEEDERAPLTLDTYSATVRYGATVAITAAEPGEHVVRLINAGEQNAESGGTVLAIAQARVLEPVRKNSLPIILGLLLAVQAVGALFAFTVGQRLFAGLANTLDTRRAILLALVVYAVIATWGYFVNSTVEFWFLAWMVAIVQGGSQALSRSLYASMSPAAKSGEFFGLYGIMERFSSILGPLLFALAVAAFGSSRPAIISLIAFFIVGGYLLTRVNIEEGQRLAREEDAALLGGASG
ncbi:MAG: MFS transporter [Anaerolineae bacterium]|nr:MFS transporter [Anaerolineae bacterium]NUQ03388.1 MFS transporter [Anaerolineae bacterium]